MVKVLNKQYPRRYLPSDIPREILVKQEAETNPEYGKPPESRSIQELLQAGVINLDKHPGPTSHEFSHWIRQLFGIKRVGHGGTLDPGVSGVLPILLGKATKLQEFLLLAGKEYVMLVRLHREVPEEELLQVAKEFEGDIYQTPPLRSAVKKQLRVRRVYYLEVLEIDGKDVLVLLGVQSGTYARKLAFDLGRALGVGAHMQELRRTRVGQFREEQAHPLYEILDAYYFWKDYGREQELRKVVLPVEAAVEHLPKIWIKDSAVAAICYGAPLTAPGVVKLHAGISPGDKVAIMTLKNELVAVAEAERSSQEILQLEKGIVARPLKVIMERGVYPRSWRSTKQL
ncbi:MAG: RNA-guided pseudouridylation complex pseudouridine synthase subunit Cbf5 [bacterium]|nr:RNA-guided pseudouridylation complex pseudouridine synthase subunit Cbf5 [bacterium]